LLAKRTIAWKIGNRDHRTLKEFLKEIGIKEKDLTPPIERDNSRTRHYLARFRRRTRVSSRSMEMVDLSLRLLFHYLHGSLRKQLYETCIPTFM
jgi:insertion element IS1 protein InsB